MTVSIRAEVVGSNGATLTDTGWEGREEGDGEPWLVQGFARELARNLPLGARGVATIELAANMASPVHSIWTVTVWGPAVGSLSRRPS